jgi:hypothetical protein
VADNFKELSLLRRNYSDLDQAYVACLSNSADQPEPVSWWQSPEIIIPSWILFFTAGFLVRNK